MNVLDDSVVTLSDKSSCFDARELSMTPVPTNLTYPSSLPTTPFVSCIVPNYNGEKYLASTVESLLNQSYSNKEVVVVDDGSTDDSIGLLSSFGNRIRMIRQTNVGVSAARNVGAHFATGELICFCDSDDLWLPSKLEDQVRFLQTHLSSVAVHTDFEPFGENEQGVKTFERWRVGPFRSTESLAVANRVIISSVMVRRSAFIQAGGFRSGVFYPADWLVWTALAEMGEFSFLDKVLVRYRLHAGSATVAMKLRHALEGFAARIFHQGLLASKVSGGEKGLIHLLSTNILDDLQIILAKQTSDHECDLEAKNFVRRILAGFSVRTYFSAFPIVMQTYFRAKFAHKRRFKLTRTQAKRDVL